MVLLGIMAAVLPLGMASACVVRHFTGRSFAVLTGWLCLAGAALVWSAWMTVETGPVLWFSLLLGWSLLMLASIDLLAYRLPDILTLPLVGAGLVAATVIPAMTFQNHLLGAVVAYASMAGLAWGYQRLRGHHGLGQGDVKLISAAGAWLGWQALPSILLGATIFGLAWFALGVIFKKMDRTSRLPFGVPLSCAIWLVWLFGPFIPDY
jgi:leader peptidase (prepilin peptidase) / N-methyltransferase